jgi:hypothetical protein
MKPEFNDYNSRDTDGAHGASRVVSWVVLALAASGFVALAWYAYQSGSESVDPNDIPVIEADSSPVKISPENPGGESFPHQDKTIYNTISGAHELAGEEKLLPEPETPVINEPEVAESEPSARTWVRKSLKEEGEDAVAEATDTPLAEATEQAVAAPAEENKEPAPLAEKLTEAPLLAEKPLADLNKTPAPQVAAQPPAAAPAPVAKKEIPLEQGKEIPIVAGAPVKVPAEAAPTKPAAAPAPVQQASGDFKVQLGAYGSQAEADSNWARINRKHSAVLAGKPYLVVKAVLPNGTYYRLRASGFASPDAAKQACSKLSAQGQACFYAGK